MVINYCLFHNSTSSVEFSDSNNHPYIVRLYDGDEALAPTYSVVVEQDVTIKCPNFTMALYSVFSLHYVFNISYHGKLSAIFFISSRSCVPDPRRAMQKIC